MFFVNILLVVDEQIWTNGLTHVILWELYRIGFEFVCPWLENLGYLNFYLFIFIEGLAFKP